MTALYAAQDFWHAVTTALQTTDPLEKCRLVNHLYDELLPQIKLTELSDFPEVTPQMDLAGIPEKPILVAPKDVPKRSFATEEGYAQQELGEGMAFVKDWLRVAREESTHFSLVNAHLHTLGYQYGDFEAHAGLWEMAQATAHDIWERMALVPRVLEARGLDATPVLQEKIAQRKDMAAVKILDVILTDEIGHVYIGNHWYHALSAKRGLDAMKCFTELLHKYRIVIFKGVINTDARLQAGFTQHELDWIYEVEQTLKSYIKQ